MRINHNIQALNAYRNLFTNQSATSKNLEKLSSGLRINRAADDAAGLAISEKMRSQIRGLKQAERNSMDGISLMQTAEGAMTEVHSMLQRMRELATQAANDTNTLSDRDAIQKEIDQLKLEIDSIAEKTEFNTRKLLDGSSAVDTQYIVGEMENTGIKNVPTVVDPSLATGRYEIAIKNTPEYQYTLNQPGGGVSQASVLEVNIDDTAFFKNESDATNLLNPPTIEDDSLKKQPGTYRITTSNITLNSPTLADGGTGITLGAAPYDGFIKDPTNSDLMLGTYTINVENFDDLGDADGTNDSAFITILDPNGNVVDKKNVTLDGVVEFGEGNKIVGLDLTGVNSNGIAKVTVDADIDIKVEKLNAEDGTVETLIVPVATFTTDEKGKVDLNGKFNLDIPASITAGESDFYTTSDLAFGEYTIVASDYQVDGSGVKSATIEVFNPDGFSIGELAATIGDDGSIQTIGTENGQTVKIDTRLITQAGTAKIQVEGKMEVEVSRIIDGSNTPITFEKMITTRNGLIEHGGMEMEFGVNARQGASQFDLTNKSLSFQIGANTDQNVNIDVPQLSTVKLGIDEINVLSHETANKAIFILDKAIDQISSVRSKLGATQNRLEHTINNLQTTHENLTSAESRIRDADMALEMTEFTKNNILNQSAQAMLAQANQLPQGVLQLLQR